ncbi:unnamed protein product [Arctogadus glacialis]
MLAERVTPDCSPQIEEELNVGGLKRLSQPTFKENSAQYQSRVQLQPRRTTPWRDRTPWRDGSTAEGSHTSQRRPNKWRLDYFNQSSD